MLVSIESSVYLTVWDLIVKIVTKEDVKKLIAFRNNPSDESWIKA